MSARDDALSAIAADPVLTRLAANVREAADDDPGHDFEHLVRVAGWTIRCVEHRAPPRRAIAAALLHDIVNVPKDDPRRAQASALSAARAREMIREHFDEEAIEQIAHAIEDHSFSRGAIPRSPLGDALQDADRLEALGALGILRTLSTATRMGSRYFDPADPWASARPLDDKRNAIDHVFVKLVHLPATMRTAIGRREAERRAQFLFVFLDALGDEIGRPRP